MNCLLIVFVSPLCHTTLVGIGAKILLSMAPQGCGRANRFAYLNDVHDSEEAARDDQLVVHLQHVEEIVCWYVSHRASCHHERPKWSKTPITKHGFLLPKNAGGSLASAAHQKEIKNNSGHHRII